TPPIAPFIPPGPPSSVTFPLQQALVYAGFNHGSGAARFIFPDESSVGVLAQAGFPLSATPDGQTLLVEDAGRNELALIKADQSLTLVTGVEPATFRGATVSPDGRAIVYATDRGLFEARVDSGVEIRLLAPDPSGALFS